MLSAPRVYWEKFVEGGVDEDFYPIPDGYAEPVPVAADFAPEATKEPRDGTTTRVVSDAQIVLDKPIDHDPRDRFIVNGVRYQAEGKALPWFGRYSKRLFGQVIPVRRL